MSIQSTVAALEPSMATLTVQEAPAQTAAGQHPNWSTLAPELLTNIFGHLNTQTLGECKEVCRDWKVVATDVQTEKLESLPTTSRNQLADTIKFLESGDYVVLFAPGRGGRFFHKCVTGLTNDQVTKYLNNTRVIYLNSARMPGLLDDGEWNWYITGAGFDECKCKAQEITGDTSKVKYQLMFRL